MKKHIGIQHTRTQAAMLTIICLIDLFHEIRREQTQLNQNFSRLPHFADNNINNKNNLDNFIFTKSDGILQYLHTKLSNNALQRFRSKISFFHALHYSNRI